MLDRLRDAIDRAIVWGNRAPWLAIRRLLWFFTFGWLLATVYLAAAVAMLASIIFAPFCYQAARLALLAADGGITLEPAADRFVLSLEAPAWGNPAHPYTIAANVIWVVLFGWSLAAMHLAAALVQAATIIGIGTAVTNVQLAMFALWPFGRGLRLRQLPTTLEELHQQRAATAMEASSARALGWA